MSNNEYYRNRAIEGSTILISKYGLVRCIHACKRICIAIDKADDTEDFRLLHLEAGYDPCLSDILTECCAKYGARLLLSAFYFWADDDLQCNLWYQIHILGANRIMNKPNELNDN